MRPTVCATPSMRWGRSVSIEYDARGNARHDRALGHTPGADRAHGKRHCRGAGRVAAGQNDQVTRFVYDAANRLRFTIDATGSVSENAYDALGNVVAMTQIRAASIAGAGLVHGGRRGCCGRSAAWRSRKPGDPLRLRRREAPALCGRRARLALPKACTTPTAICCRRCASPHVRQSRRRTKARSPRQWRPCRPILEIASRASPTTRSIACASPSMHSARSASVSTTRWAT